ncbi:MLO-like protein 9 [Cucumis sativus]|uniref:MLO-like protein 9 n=1 Tax=Cucumis sativus TaxID=3659 RepID=UPI0012F51C0B|nr:MLO-like protein 9 [Cucumis sativus]
MIWGFYLSPMMYGQNAIGINEFLDDRWSKRCFFRQIFKFVGKADYLALCHGFIEVNLARGCKFDVKKHIKRYLKDGFKIIVGVR